MLYNFTSLVLIPYCTDIWWNL